MTKKQEKIKEAYGQYWDALSEHAKNCALLHNGYISPIISGSDEMPREFLTYNDSGFRPKSLAGLKDNNGWISIESEADFPTEDDCGYFILKDGKPEYWYWPKHEALNSAAWLSVITHWQKTEMPKPPIY